MSFLIPLETSFLILFSKSGKKINYFQIRKFSRTNVKLPKYSYLSLSKKEIIACEISTYLYRYTFCFPKKFSTYPNAYDLRVKIF